jgi:hypothetical protein
LPIAVDLPLPAACVSALAEAEHAQTHGGS